MAKPPPAPPSSDIGGVNRDMRLDSLPSGDPAQGHELAERSAEDRARPPKNADPANEGLARDAENGA